MLRLPFRDGAFDLIWSEGAIYIIGFERGLREWRWLLRPGWFLAVSEVSWLKPEPPREVRDFWRAAYPGLKTVEQNIAAVRAGGYDLVGHFVLPEADWWDSYYGPLAERLSVLQEKYGEDPEVLAVLEQESAEITLFRRYPSTYGYVFFVMKRGREGVPKD